MRNKSVFIIYVQGRRYFMKDIILSVLTFIGFVFIWIGLYFFGKDVSYYMAMGACVVLGLITLVSICL